ncbi:proline-rich receptor-like protein kinase PERK2 [Triticum urartu]|uniref:proline-rich receptor-like protein kinase PERK2 n=1 Tax=Triticum urartu TaxID=4572 RepID=UPI002042EDBB|nr:proline-rich receptor-like protein kinase PERK2 [Triticum urartu]XP_048560728.1 proline-rich receptor-like protein kinase PERK2 [Triticum urartu]
MAPSPRICRPPRRAGRPHHSSPSFRSELARAPAPVALPPRAPALAARKTTTSDARSSVRRPALSPPPSSMRASSESGRRTSSSELSTPETTSWPLNPCLALVLTGDAVQRPDQHLPPCPASRSQPPQSLVRDCAKSSEGSPCPLTATTSPAPFGGP